MVVVALLVGAVGTASSASKASDAESERDEAVAAREAIEDELADTEGDRDQAERRADDLEDDVADAEAEAEDALEAARTQVEQENAGRVAEMDARQTSLDQREAGLAQREAAVTAAEGQLDQTSFGDGIYEVGRDIQPGRYHTDGSSRGCYYALLRQPNGEGVDHIIDNNNIDGPATIDIRSPFFETSGGCTWVLVG